MSADAQKNLSTITWQQFEAVDIRVGTIVEAEIFVGARKPAYKLKIDLGELGIKRSSAQITQHYTCKDLVGKQVICVTNFPTKQIGPFISEVLTTGFLDDKGYVVLTTVAGKVPNGAKLM